MRDLSRMAEVRSAHRASWRRAPRLESLASNGVNDGFVNSEKIKYQKSKCKIVESAYGGASILYGRTALMEILEKIRTDSTGKVRLASSS